VVGARARSDANGLSAGKSRPGHRVGRIAAASAWSPDVCADRELGAPEGLPASRIEVRVAGAVPLLTMAGEGT